MLMFWCCYPGCWILLPWSFSS